MSMFHSFFLHESTTTSASFDLQPTRSRGRNDHNHILFMNLTPHVGAFTNKAKQMKCNRAKELLLADSNNEANSASICHTVVSVSSVWL